MLAMQRVIRLSLYDFTAPEAARTNAYGFPRRTNLRLDFDNIGLPYALRFVVRMADRISGYRTFSTNLAPTRHVIYLPSYLC